MDHIESYQRDVLPLVNDLHIGIITSLHLHLSIIDRKNHSFPKGLSNCPRNPDFKTERSNRTYNFKKILSIKKALMQSHIFDFRSEVQTGSGPFPYDIGIFRHEILPDDNEIE